MNPNEFITLSGKLVSYGEAGARSAVSRAYYGAYHCAIECLNRLQAGVSGNGASHSAVPHFFQDAAHDLAKEAGGLLSDLHSERVKADYHLDKPKYGTEPLARSCVEMACAIVARINQFELDCKNDAMLLTSFRTSVAKIKEVRGLR